MSSQQSSPLLTSADLSAELGVPIKTLDQWAWKGGGPAFLKIGRHRRYRREDVDAWLDGRRVESQPA
jgi:excisionase family DNA binding protein